MTPLEKQTGLAADASANQLDHLSGYQESMWLVALYETEERIQELLERLRRLGVATEEASIVRVELNDQQRAAGSITISHKQIARSTRYAITGAVLGGTIALLGGLALYETALLKLEAFAGLPEHALAFVSGGSLLGALIGFLTAKARPKPLPRAATNAFPEIASDGYLVAVKLPPELGEQAETIARSLGAKQILC